MNENTSRPSRIFCILPVDWKEGARKPLPPRGVLEPTFHQHATATTQSASARTSIVPHNLIGSSTTSNSTGGSPPRYDKLAVNYLAFVQLASMVVGLPVRFTARMRKTRQVRFLRACKYKGFTGDLQGNATFAFSVWQVSVLRRNRRSDWAERNSGIPLTRRRSPRAVRHCKIQAIYRQNTGNRDLRLPSCGQRPAVGAGCRGPVRSSAHPISPIGPMTIGRKNVLHVGNAASPSLTASSPAKAGDPVFTVGRMGCLRCPIDLLRSTGSSACADDDGRGNRVRLTRPTSSRCSPSRRSPSSPGRSCRRTGGRLNGTHRRRPRAPADGSAGGWSRHRPG